MARDPGAEDTVWGCEECGATFPSSLVTGLVMEVTEMLEMTGQADMGGLEFLVTMYEGCLHPRHSVMLGIKRYLIYIYGRAAEASQPEHLRRKIEYCTQILKACDLVMPGMTRGSRESTLTCQHLRPDQGEGAHPVRAGCRLHRPRGEAARGDGGEPEGGRGLPPVGEEWYLRAQDQV